MVRLRDRVDPVGGDPAQRGGDGRRRRVDREYEHHSCASRADQPGPWPSRLADPGVVVATLQPHHQVLLRQLLDLALAPLHHRDRLGQAGVEVEVVHFGHPAQPVRVHVHQWQRPAPLGVGPVDPRDDERRRGDLTGHGQTLPDPPDQGGLAGAQRPVQDDQIARPQQPRPAGVQRRRCRPPSGASPSCAPSLASSAGGRCSVETGRRGEPRPTGQVVVQLDLVEAAVGAQQRRHDVGVGLVVLDGDRPARAQQGGRPAG